MRNFIIDLAEKILGVFIAMSIVGVAYSAFQIMSTAPADGGGVLKGLIVLAVGLVAAIVIGGVLYMGFGLYRSSQWTNHMLREFLER